MTCEARWARLGVLFGGAPAPEPVDVETLLIDTVREAADHPRLFWVAASWLCVHHRLVNLRRLGQRLRALPETAVAGALLSLVDARVPGRPFRGLLAHCRPVRPPRPLFSEVERSPVLRAKVARAAHPLFRRWGLLQDELALRPGSVRPTAWVLQHNPPLRLRALFGADLRAEILATLRTEAMSVAELARRLGATYAATHEALSALEAGLLVTARQQGRQKRVALSAPVRRWLDRAPLAAPRLGARTT
jgi:DNA-binding transcriptional ArsR family regulator